MGSAGSSHAMLHWAFLVKMILLSKYLSSIPSKGLFLHTSTHSGFIFIATVFKRLLIMGLQIRCTSTYRLSTMLNIFMVPLFVGEAMEKGLRDCCRSIRIGKILIKMNEEAKTPMVKQLL